MKSFDILHRELDIHRNYLLEASAGTGKTFSIENIVVRLLLEKTPLLLEQILIVTFTRAATRDLRERVRSALSNAHSACVAALSGAAPAENSADYLIPYLTAADGNTLAIAKRNLEQALFCYDQAQIFTIHGFCARMLAENPLASEMISRRKQGDEEFLLNAAVIVPIIRDFFRCELSTKDFSPQQLKILLKDHDNEIESLERALSRVIASAPPILCSAPPFSASLELFRAAMLQIRQEAAPTPEGIMADFLLQAPFYKELCDRKRQPKAEVVAIIERFSKLFGKESWDTADFDQLLADQLFYLSALSPQQRGAKAPPDQEQLRHPSLQASLERHMSAIVCQAASPTQLFARLAAACQRLLQRQLLRQQRHGPDMLLRSMGDALHNSAFVTEVRHRYKAAIIDEFQDTDPLQWQIFRTLFLAEEDEAAGRWPGKIYLVGDPKQSIYAFRHADIYTYLAAAKALGEGHHATLDVNWRSTDDLVHALNTVFSESCAPALIPLPKADTFLPYRPVRSSSRPAFPFSDELGALHFFVAEGKGEGGEQRSVEADYFFPFIAQQICRLHTVDKLPMSAFAVLVADRYQGERFSAFCRRMNIPTAAQRSLSLADSPAVSGVCELLRGIIHPGDESCWRKALGSPLIGWGNGDLKKLDDELQRTRLTEAWHRLRWTLFDRGFAPFLEELLASHWHGDSDGGGDGGGDDVATRLLVQEGGERLLADLLHVGELLTAWQYNEGLTPDKLLRRLEQLFQDELQHESEALRKRGDPADDAVQIVTVHASKGLEFDVVFALGLTKQPPQPSLLIPDPGDSTGPAKMRLIAAASRDEEIYQRYCDEIDAEKMRQLYVAMTRAKQRLYVPAALIRPKSGKLERGSAAAMELFVARLGRPAAAGVAELYQRIAAPDAAFLYAFLESCRENASISFTRLNEAQLTLPEPLEGKEGDAAAMVAPSSLKTAIIPRFLHSFTSLAKRGGGSYEEREGLGGAPNKMECSEKSVHTLPSGTALGNLLHSLLEEISFAAVRQAGEAAALLPWVCRKLQHTPFSGAGWDAPIAELLFNALHTPLHPHGSQPFSLAEVDEACTFREMPFLFPCDALAPSTDVSSVSSEDMTQGFIDLFFSHAGRYYLIDWKSNWLGPAQHCYNREALACAMAENGYTLQASLYCEAARRFLSAAEPYRSFDECFGGIFYLFLRGIDPAKDPACGIFQANL